MEFAFLAIALITAGISLAMGCVSLFSGLHKDGEKIDLLFGIMCLSLFIYFIIPPIGFVLLDKAPYPFLIIIKRAFNFFYAAMIPWFILQYSGYTKRILPLLNSVLCVFSYLVMAFTKTDSLFPLWMGILVVALGVAVIHGFMALRYQVRSGERGKAKWLRIAMIFFLIFYTPTVVNLFSDNYFGKLIHAKLFYPINLFPLAFLLIMGVRLRSNSYERFRLGKVLRLRNIRWSSLMENMQIMVVNLDTQGMIKYINPYAVELLGFESSSIILNSNWFDHVIPAGEVSFRKMHFEQIMLKDSKTLHHKGEVICKNGERKIISWSNQAIYNDEGLVDGSISIGTDITEQEKYFNQIHDLKAELEKENLLLKGEPLPDWMNNDIIGKSPAITYTIHKARQVAQTNATVLLEGETGVGKELFADLIQRSSLRNAMPFVKVNCGALPAELIEDELFGHEKGAFTGAIQSRKGRFELANGGTLFLDELGELPLVLQAKLLRVLQDGEFLRVGGQETIKVDVRVIAATNRDLEKEVKEGRFRDDLFYRLNVFPITIPSLRSRKEDIPMLVQYFIENKAKKHGKQFDNISKLDIQNLREYAWPGNIGNCRM